MRKFAIVVRASPTRHVVCVNCTAQLHTGMQQRSASDTPLSLVPRPISDRGMRVREALPLFIT
jgi:hypothetical protein